MRKLGTLSTLSLIFAALLSLIPFQAAKALWLEDSGMTRYPPTPVFSEEGSYNVGPVYWNKYTCAEVEVNYYEDGWFFNNGCYTTVMVKPASGQSETESFWLRSQIEINRMWEWTGGGEAGGVFNYGCNIGSSLWVQGEAEAGNDGSASCEICTFSIGSYGNQSGGLMLWGDVENDALGESDSTVYGSPTLYTEGGAWSALEFFRENERWELEIENAFSMSGLNVVYMDFLSYADLIAAVTAERAENGRISKAEITTSEAGVHGEVWAYIN